MCSGSQVVRVVGGLRKEGVQNMGGVTNHRAEQSGFHFGDTFSNRMAVGWVEARFFLTFEKRFKTGEVLSRDETSPGGESDKRLPRPVALKNFIQLGWGSKPCAFSVFKAKRYFQAFLIFSLSCFSILIEFVIVTHRTTMSLTLVMVGSGGNSNGCFFLGFSKIILSDFVVFNFKLFSFTVNKFEDQHQYLGIFFLFLNQKLQQSLSISIVYQSIVLG